MADPGWYPDPAGMAPLRFFDGQNWTTATAALPDEFRYQSTAAQPVLPVVQQSVQQTAQPLAQRWPGMARSRASRRRRTRFYAALASGVAVVAAVAVAVPLALSAGSDGQGDNGEAAKTGAQVLKDSTAELAASGAVHVSGTMATESGTIKLDLQMQSEGTSGTLTLDGTPIQLIKVGAATYIKAPRSYYAKPTETSPQADAVANRWVKLPSTVDAFNGFSLSKMAADLGDSTKTDSPIQRQVTLGSRDGHRVVYVHQADGSWLAVAATGKPYPVAFANSAASKDGAGSATFSNYGKHEVITPPAQVLVPTRRGTPS